MKARVAGHLKNSLNKAKTEDLTSVRIRWRVFRNRTSMI